MAIVGKTKHFFYGTTIVGVDDWKIGTFKKDKREFKFLPTVPYYVSQFAKSVNNYLKSKILTIDSVFPKNREELIKEVKKYLKLYLLSEKIKRGKEPPLEYPHNEELPPYPYQRIGTSLLILNDFYALFCEQGTGKTRMSIDALNYLYENNDIRKVLIATPNSVIYSWVSDFKKFCVVPYRLFPAVTKKRQVIKEWLEAPDDALNVLIIGYDFLWRLFPDLRSDRYIDVFKEVAGEKKLKSFLNACKKAYKGRKYRQNLKKKIMDILLKENNPYIKSLMQDTLTALEILDTTQVVIADESQRIKTHSAKRTRAFLRIALNAERKYILSGTPITNTPLDIVSQMKFLHILSVPTIQKFKLYFVDAVNKGQYELVKGIKKGKEEEFKQLINGFSFIVKKEDVLKDLPDKIFIEREVILPEQASKAYRMLEREMAAELNVAIKLEEEAKSLSEEDTEKKKEIQKQLITTASHLLTKLVRLNQLTGGFLVDDDDEKPYPVHREKINAVLEILEELGDKKAIIWANYRYEVEMIYKAIKKAKYKCAYITGEVDIKKRKQILQDFQEGDLQVLIANPATLSTGVTLTATDTAIYYSLTFKLEDFLQSQDRIHRIGQNSSVVTYYIILSRLHPSVVPAESEQTRTIDRKIYKSLQGKQRIANEVVKFAKEYLEIGDGKSVDACFKS